MSGSADTLPLEEMYAPSANVAYDAQQDVETEPEGDDEKDQMMTCADCGHVWDGHSQCDCTFRYIYTRSADVGEPDVGEPPVSATNAEDAIVATDTPPNNCDCSY